MEIRQLRYFLSAAEHLNFTKAAKECCIVQTAMTQQSANLENEIGTKLFERNRRMVRLTPAGEAFLREAKTVLARAEQAVRQARSCAAGYESMLRIGYHGELVKRDLAALLKIYRAGHPQIKVLLYQQTQEELIEALENEETDFGFSLHSGFYDTLPWLCTRILGEEKLKLVVSKEHPLAGYKQVYLAQVKDEPFIFFDEKSMEEREIQMAEKGVFLKRYGEICDHTSGELLIRSGYGIAIWAERLCDESRLSDLAFLDILDHLKTVPLCISWKSGEQGEPMRSFLELADRYFGINERTGATTHVHLDK